jgi:hypothetical protein
LFFPLLLLIAGAASAADCPPVGEQVTRAWDAFYDAELEEAKNTVSAAVQSLKCQSELVNTETLMELYRVDALISLTKDDRKGSVYATIRAVTVDPNSGPPSDMGPELGELYADWSQRLGESKIAVRLADDGEAWVDGKKLVTGEYTELIAGEHLIQYRDDEMIRSSVEELTSNWVIVTGPPIPNTKGGAPTSTGPDPIPYELPSRVAATEATIPQESGRRRPWGFGLAGALTTAAGGAMLGVSVAEEQRFLSLDYLDATYNGCARGQDCYQSAREDAIRADANRVQVLYGSAYGLLTAGVATSLVSIIGLPAYTDGRTINLQIQF